MSEQSAFGYWLKQRRKELGITQKELARGARCSTVTIEKIESGARKPSVQVANFLADFLEVPAQERALFAEFARRDGPQGADNVPGRRAPWLGLNMGRNNLPAPATAFIGREAEVAGACALLMRAGVRLVTVTGPPGVGKTRTALQVAATLNFADGVFFVPLASIRDPKLVPAVIASALGVREQPRRTLLESVKEHLGDKEMLLVLDNFEQLLPAGPLIAELLAAAPQVKMLVTSRELLYIYGEHNFPLPPMEVPDPRKLPPARELMASAAIRLFVERASALRPSFALTEANASTVAAICLRLDGLPLAIELAASHIEQLSAEEVLTRLERRLSLLVEGPKDRSPRQQTLRGAIDWSYDLLEPPEQRLFRHLAVFAGGCTLEGVVAVIGGERGAPEEGATAFALRSLVTKNLLQQEQREGQERYRMLETIREYASERLVEHGEADMAQGRHAAYYLAVAEQAGAEADGLIQLGAEHTNIRAALQYSLDGGDPVTALNLGAAMWRFWITHGHLSEGMRWLMLALEAGKGAPEEVRAAALKGAGNLAFNAGDYPLTRRLYENGLALRRASGDKQGMAQLLNNLSVLELTTGNYEEAKSLLRESLALKRELGDAQGVAASLANLAIIERDQGSYAEARALQEESLTHRREMGEKQGIALALHGLACITLIQGDDALASALLKESLAISEELGDQQISAMCLLELAEAARFREDYRGAVTLGEKCVEMLREQGGVLDLGIALHNLGQSLLLRGQIERAEEHIRESLKIRAGLEDKRGIIECLAALGGVATARRESKRALQLFAMVEALSETTGFRLYPLDRAEFSRNLDRARAELGEIAWRSAQEAMRRLEVEQAVRYVAGE